MDEKKPEQSQAPELTEEQMKEQNEVMKQIEMNENAINDIKEGIAKSMPFVSKKMSVDEYKEHWKDNKFYESFKNLLNKYSKARELRRDGNCFYRALMWQMFEYFLTNKSSEAQAEYEKILDKITKSKEALLNVGFEEIVVEDFYDLFLLEFKNLKTADIDTTNEDSIHEYLESLFSNNEKAPYMIMFTRYMTSCYLKENAVLYEAFMVEYGDVASFWSVEIEGIDREAEQIAIIGITNFLGIATEINQVRDNGSLEILTLPEDAVDDGKRFIGKLLFTPGHYDALYC